jgi:uncharacterized repeat protein (TIGR03803 family)
MPNANYALFRLFSAVKRIAAFALAGGLAWSARAQIGTGWTPASEHYIIQTSAGCSAVPFPNLPNGIGGVFNISSGAGRSEFRFEDNLPNQGFTSGTEQFQGDVTVNSLGGDRIILKQTFGGISGSDWNKIGVTKANGGELYEVYSGEGLASYTIGTAARINTILTFAGGIPAVNVYINGTLVEQLVGNGAYAIYDKAGAYAASSGSGPCTSAWENILFWTGGSSNGGAPVAVDTPSFSPAAGTYAAQTVTISSTTGGASIDYTTDGSTPTETHGTLLSSGGSVSLGSSVTLNAIAFKSGQTDSPVTTAAYTILSPVATPAFSPAAGTYTSAQTVTISSATSGASIAYTTDGSPPMENNGTVTHGTLLASGGSVALGGSVTLNAIAFESGLADSTTATATYSIQAALPTFSPVAGIYTSAQSVTINSTTNGATIIYTTDGSPPTESGGFVTNGIFYAGPVDISSTTLLKAIAYETGFTDSQVASGLYTIGSPAAVLNVIYNFTTANNGGIDPQAGLVQGSDGNFYGTAYDGGIEDGAVFKITPAGVLAASASFYHTNGAHPYGAGLVQGTDGNFYGTTEIGGSTYTGLLGNAGYGTVFKMTPAGVLTTLVSFTGTNGEYPEAGLVQGGDGNFYGTTESGGNNGYGTVFRMTPAGVLTTLVSFDYYTNGGVPVAALVQGGDGNFYGTTESGGHNGYGTVFQMTPAGVLTTLVSFDYYTNGGVPVAALVQGSDGNFYGTTESGGNNGYGTVFRMTPTGVLTTLVSFTDANGGNPQVSLVQGSDGNFYGTTESGGSGNEGTVFQMTPAGALTTLASFDGANGANPQAGLVQGSDGNFYGTTLGGGSSSAGVLFQLIIPLPPTAAPVFSPPPGAFASALNVTMMSTTPGASIYYTTDGSRPSGTNGMLYSTGVGIGSTTALDAIARKAGFSDSPVTSGIYTVGSSPPPQVAAPAFSLAAGTYASAQYVIVTSTTYDATIRYTTDGSAPSETHGALLSSGGAVSISATATLSAIAYEAGFSDSPVTRSLYTIEQVAAPVFSPAAGTYTGAQSVIITSATGGASIRYTTDGSAPTETNGILYSSPVNISTTTLLKAVGYETGFIDSLVTSGIYTSTNSPAAILKVICNLSTAGNGGINPYARLVQGGDGTFYGTTNAGGSGNGGAVFKMTPAGVLTTLVSFTGNNGSGANPFAALVQGSDGNFYGTTYKGGYDNEGTVFMMTPAGALTNLDSFTGFGATGEYPEAGLVQGSNGNFYGTTANGGSANEGTVFMMTPAGVLTTLVSFTGNNGSGANPFAALIQGSDGNFYGTTASGGSSYHGTVFKLTPAGAISYVVSFTGVGAIGKLPEAGLVQGSDGNFYGTTSSGGSSDDGTIFKLTPAGVFTTLVSFTNPNGADPIAGLVQGSDGNFYGTTFTGGRLNDGAIFEMTPAGALTLLASFDGANGANPRAGLVQGEDGNFYGTTSTGGASNDGVIFQLILPPAAAPSFNLPAGLYTGPQSVTISAAGGAMIVYTTDGTTPSGTNGTAVPVGESVTLTLTTTTTLSAIVYEPGYTGSTVTTAIYTINTPIPTMPRINGSNEYRQ